MGSTVRLALPRDAEAIRAIHNHYVEQSTIMFDMVARTAEAQLVWLEAHVGGYAAVVCEDETGTVVGFGSLSKYRQRSAYNVTVEDSVYVAPGRTGAGTGRLLLAELVELARAHGFHSIIARITGDNEPSVRLHNWAGFDLVGREREVGRKHRHWLDVVVMQRMLNDAATGPVEGPPGRDADPGT
ncbi:MAG: sortase-like acyltransferase [Actinomycetia bacterium]|nr:sortase-like acyltransferase [Actinomycetes bacterium]